MIREFVLLLEFEKCWNKIGMNDEDLRELENYLCLYPESGNVTPGTGGLRKLRWGVNEKGKRNSARIIYVDFAHYEKTYLIGAYLKSEKIKLDEKQKANIKRLIKILEQELKGK